MFSLFGGILFKFCLISFTVQKTESRLLVSRERIINYSLAP